MGSFCPYGNLSSIARCRSCGAGLLRDLSEVLQSALDIGVDAGRAPRTLDCELRRNAGGTAALGGYWLEFDSQIDSPAQDIDLAFSRHIQRRTGESQLAESRDAVGQRKFRRERAE